MKKQSVKDAALKCQKEEEEANENNTKERRREKGWTAKRTSIASEITFQRQISIAIRNQFNPNQAS